MVDPKILCTKHLLGEHVEIHMFVGTIKKGKSLRGYVDNNLVEPGCFVTRHNDLVREHISRGGIHKSSLNLNEVIDLVDTLERDIRENNVDSKKSLQELLFRCPRCKERFDSLYASEFR